MDYPENLLHEIRMLNPEQWLTTNPYGDGYSELAPEERKAIANFCLLWSLCELKCLDNNACPNIIKRKVENLHSSHEIDLRQFYNQFRYFRDRYYDGVIFNSKFDNLRLANNESR